jgi:hypothetical protein
MLKLGRKFLGHVLPGIVRPMHILWNEIIGFVFICLALIAVPKLWTFFKQFDGQTESIVHLAPTLLFFLIMLFFGLDSFRRAKKIERS